MLTVILRTHSKYLQVRARESAYSASKRNRHASLEKHVSNLGLVLKSRIKVMECRL